MKTPRNDWPDVIEASPVTHLTPSQSCLVTDFLVVDSEKESDFYHHHPHLCLQGETAIINVDTAYSSCSGKVVHHAGYSEDSPSSGYKNGQIVYRIIGKYIK